LAPLFTLTIAAVDIDKDFEIIPTWSIHKWTGAILPRKPKRKVPPKPTEETERKECLPRPISGGTGLLTPAPSFDSATRKKVGLLIPLLLLTTYIDVRGGETTHEIAQRIFEVTYYLANHLEAP
jgi:hypothetical protein